LGEEEEGELATAGTDVDGGVAARRPTSDKGIGLAFPEAKEDLELGGKVEAEAEATEEAKGNRARGRASREEAGFKAGEHGMGAR
jgi:hypothetical protein